MSVRGIGVDVVDIERFAVSLERTPSLRQRLLTPAEAELSIESMAGRFAAKEAFVKALRAPAGLSWTDIEVVTDDRGAPSFELTGPARARVRDLGITALHLSISHDGPVATAFVVAEAG
ncbi:MAG: holo-ACP synthase [Aeromicrobium sp.]|uniref:holo-ACP synthase n=1 Tax=Aeromicrobium sp. TaxID=1871063 RepID=UPI0039E520E5